MGIYRIVRFYQGDQDSVVIAEGITIEDAQLHCMDDESSSRTCVLPSNVDHTMSNGAWFDGYERMG